MLLPNSENAIIAPEKLRDFLLSGSHPDNHGRARFFTALGYHQDIWQQLASDIAAQHLICDADYGHPSDYGTTYEIVAILRGPLGSAKIKSVWIIDWEDDVPRFVTAYPD